MTTGTRCSVEGWHPCFTGRTTPRPALSPGHSPLAAVAVGAILLPEDYACLAAEILALWPMVPFASSAVSVTALLRAV